jgi:hypothetical protein
MRKEVLYNLCRPLYGQIKILLLTGGEPLHDKESFPFCKFMCENYPQVTITLETNGIAFSREWQELAAENYMRVHVSVNASNEDIFTGGCWSGAGGATAFRMLTKNIEEYMEVLREKELEIFSPDISMVINKDTASDVRNFVRYALSIDLHSCKFFFDYTENDMNGECFGIPETSRPALFELMKLERVLAGKFFMYFRLWIPLQEQQMMQPQVEAIPMDALVEEYADILELAEGRSMKDEYEDRQRLRKEKGKKEFTFDEEWSPTIRQINVQGKVTCFAPFSSLDIYPNDVFDCCGWISPPRFVLNKAVVNKEIDWDAKFNNIEMRSLRKNMLEDRYDICMKCCPLNPMYKSAYNPHEFGYKREERLIETN